MTHETIRLEDEYDLVASAPAQRLPQILFNRSDSFASYDLVRDLPRAGRRSRQLLEAVNAEPEGPYSPNLGASGPDLKWSGGKRSRRASHLTDVHAYNREHSPLCHPNVSQSLYSQAASCTIVACCDSRQWSNPLRTYSGSNSKIWQILLKLHSRV